MGFSPMFVLVTFLVSILSVERVHGVETVTIEINGITTTATLLSSGDVNIAVRRPCPNNDGSCWIAFGISDKDAGTPNSGSMLSRTCIGENGSTREVVITAKSGAGISTVTTPTLESAEYWFDGTANVLNITGTSIADTVFGDGSKRYVVAYGNSWTATSRHSGYIFLDSFLQPLFATETPTTTPTSSPTSPPLTTAPWTNTSSPTNATSTPSPTDEVVNTTLPTASPTFAPTVSPVESLQNVEISLDGMEITATATEVFGELNIEIRLPCSGATSCWIGFGISDKQPGEPEPLSMASRAIIADFQDGIREYTIGGRSKDAIVESSSQDVIESEFFKDGDFQVLNFTTSAIAGRRLAQGQRYIVAHGSGGLNYHDVRYATELDNKFNILLPVGSPTSSPTKLPTLAPTAPAADIVVNPTDDMQVTFSAVGENKLKVRVELQAIAWLAVGISDAQVGESPSMLGNAVIARPGFANEVDEYVIRARRIGEITEFTDRKSLEDVVLTQTDGVTTLEFVTRAIGSRDVSAEEDVWMFAHGADNTFAQHRGSDRDAATISYTGLETTFPPSTSPQAASLILLHGALMVIAWMVVFPIGILFVSLFKSSAQTVKETWMFNVHKRMQGLGTFLTFVGFIAIVVHVSNQQQDHFTDVGDGHAQFGLAVVLLMLFQTIVAQFRPHKPDRLLGETKKTPMPRTLWEYSHRLFGGFLLLGGLIQCYLGSASALVAPDGTRTGFIAVCVVGTLLILVIIAKITLLKKQPRLEYDDEADAALTGNQPPPQVELINS